MGCYLGYKCLLCAWCAILSLGEKRTLAAISLFELRLPLERSLGT